VPSIATLARREAEAACSGLIVGFANHIDRAEYPQVVALFASDATLERPGAALRGSREIEAFLHQRPRHVMTRHLCTNVSIDVVSEGRAEGSAYVLFFSAEAGADTHLPLPCAPSAVVEYHARFRQEDGQWRIDGLKIAPVFRA
jgi:hypothetical protein